MDVPLNEGCNELSVWRLFLALDERHLVAGAWPARSRRIAAPYFIFNTLEFGHPLKTGYDF